jgi:S-adenosylmethionine synthetase
MFGYATDETEQCMPLTVVLAHELNHKLAQLRRDGVLWWARPDTKTQVSELSGERGTGQSAPKRRSQQVESHLWENT